MKRILVVTGFLALAFGNAAHAITIGEIATTNTGCGVGCYQIGDKLFTGIQIVGHNTATEGTWADSGVDVFGNVDADGTVFINFNLPAVAGAYLGVAGDHVDFGLLYNVATTGGQLIWSIDQHIVGSPGLDGGFVQVKERVNNSTDTQQLAFSVVSLPGDSNDPNAEANDQLVLSTPVSVAHIAKDILLIAGSDQGPGGVTSLTIITQSFHQVPEPAHAAFLLGGCLIIGLYYKSRKSAQA